MSVSTIYVNATAYRFSCNHEQGKTLDQQVNATSAESWGTDTTLFAQAYHGSGSNSYDTYRSTIVFDTSSIPDNATISSAILNLYRKKERWNDGIANYIDICPVTETGNAAGYYNKALYWGASVAELYANGNSDNVDQWWRPNIPVANINKTGNTIFGARHYHDYYNASPWQDNCTGQIYFAANSDATYKPYLTITYTTSPAVTTGAASSIGVNTVTLAGNVTDAGGGTVSERGIVYGLSANPTVANGKKMVAGTTGAYTGDITDLAGSTLYHYRAYVITENSTQYGADATFTTLPACETDALSAIGVGSLTANGEVTSAGEEITERGFVWDTDTAPTTSDNKVVVTGTTGVMAKFISALPVGRRVYLRAFATNATGTVYGNEVSTIMFGGAATFSPL